MWSFFHFIYHFQQIVYIVRYIILSTTSRIILNLYL